MMGLNSVIRNSPQAPMWEAPKVDSSNSLLQSVKNLFVTPDVPTAHVQQARRSFEHYIEREIAPLSAMLGPQGAAQLSSEAHDKFDQIVHRAFDELPLSGDDTVGGKAFAQAMHKAGKAAVNALDRLKVDAARIDLMSHLPKVDIRPQIIPKDGRYVVIRPAPQIENLVLRGGGTKGVGYGAALDQLSAAGTLAGVKHIAGSSAGALMATCMASGMSASGFDDEVCDTIYRSGVTGLLSGGSDLARLYPGLTLEGGVAVALAPLKAVDQGTATSVQGYLAAHADDAAVQAKIGAMPGPVQARLRLLAQPQDFDADRTGKMITFGDLKVLHELAPDTFKLLTLTTWNKTDQKEAYFDAQVAQNVPVAYAARASMAYPVAFKGIALHTKDHGTKLFGDGGIGSNMPSEVFIRPRDQDGKPQELRGSVLQETRARTMLLTFDENGEAYQVMHDAPPTEKAPGILDSIKAYFVNFFSSHPDQAGASRADDEKVREAGPNALPVFHGDIGTLAPSISDDRLHQAQLSSAWKALEQIDARTQQAYAMSFDRLEDVAAQLTEAEKAALRSGSAPTALQRELLAAVDGRAGASPLHVYC